jgi:hypothetical protein
MMNDVARKSENALTEYLLSSGAPLLLFRQGQYSSGDEKIPLGTRYRPKPREHMVGMQRWQDKKPAESRMGYLHEGFVIPDRSTLGFLDKLKWDKDQNGNPRDPWQPSESMPFIASDGEEYLFTTGSWGGHCAFVRLQKAFRLGDGRDPVIELATENHKNQFGGINPRPVFPVIGWVGKTLTPLPKSIGEMIDDEIPF